MKKKLDLRSEFATGNVVKWNNGIYIVARIHDDSLALLPINFSNSSSHPSRTWPTKRVFTCNCDNDDWHNEYCEFEEVPDETLTVDTVKLIADNIESWLKKKFKKILFSD